MEDFQYLINERNANLVSDFEQKLAKLSEEDLNFIYSLMANKKDIVINDLDISNEEAELRLTAGKVLNAYSKASNLLFGGSADLFSSCKNYIEDGKDFEESNYAGKNIRSLTVRDRKSVV